MTDDSSAPAAAKPDRSDDKLLPELVAHLRENRTELRQQWAERITEAHLLSSMTNQEVFSEATSVYDNYVEVLETGRDSGRGNWAALYDAAAKHTYVYMHMSAPASVAAGDRLEPGEEVGLLGCTGSCDGAHLHFEIREGRSPYATPIDPLPELQRWQPAR